MKKEQIEQNSLEKFFNVLDAVECTKSDGGSYEFTELNALNALRNMDVRHSSEELQALYGSKDLLLNCSEHLNGKYFESRNVISKDNS